MNNRKLPIIKEASAYIEFKILKVTKIIKKASAYKEFKNIKIIQNYKEGICLKRKLIDILESGAGDNFMMIDLTRADTDHHHPHLPVS